MNRPRTRRLALLVLVALLSWTSRARADGFPPAGTYTIDRDGSSVGFSVVEMLVNTVNGRFHAFSGKVVVGDSIGQSSIEASIDVDTIDTDTKKRDEHLRGADYFDVKQFPKMTFKSTGLWGTASDFHVKGDLTIHGVTKEVVLAAHVLAGTFIAAETTIQRSDFGLTNGKVIKNEVKLHLKIKLTKAS